MSKSQYLHKLVTHNLGVFIAMCYMDFHKLFSMVDEWLYIKRGKGDSLKYHTSKMASVFSDDFIVNNAPYFIAVDLVKLLKLSDKHSLYFRMFFHNAQLAQYIFSKENLEWIEVLKNIRTGVDYVNAAEKTKLTSARQIRHVLGDDAFDQFVKLPIVDALAFIEKRANE